MEAVETMNAFYEIGYRFFHRPHDVVDMNEACWVNQASHAPRHIRSLPNLIGALAAMAVGAGPGGLWHSASRVSSKWRSRWVNRSA